MVEVVFRAAVVRRLTRFAGSISEEIASELGIVPVRIEPRAGAVGPRGFTVGDRFFEPSAPRGSAKL